MKTETKTISPETVYIFKIAGGVSILATASQFEKHWKDVVIDKGLTYSAELYKEESNG